MDKGRTGLHATLEYLDTIKEFTVIGARRSGESQRIVSKNNITLGFVSYTYGLNGNTLPTSEPNLVSLINKDKMTEEITALRPLCDFLRVSMHWGDEYALVEPVASQTDLAAFLAALNVDLIIGHHPHVLQRVETLPRPDGKTMLCYYSLGNFCSHQREKDRLLGGMALVTFTKDGDTLSISNFGLLPVVTHYERGFINTKIYPYYAYTPEMMAKHSLRVTDRTMDHGYYNGVLNRLNVKIVLHDPFAGTGW
jgi:poly-gamma-glutamate synthesis protein (capsule biosynthesis protein)